MSESDESGGEILEIDVTLDESGARVDTVIAARTQLSRSFAAGLIDDGLVSLDDDVVKKRNKKVRDGQRILVEVPPAAPTDILPQNIPLVVVYEDSDLIVIDKVPGMVVHPAPGHPDGTLVNALLHHCDDLSGIGGEERPGIVHRIDRQTSGLLVVAKNDRAHQHLSELFRSHDIKREYVALCAHVNGDGFDGDGTIRTKHTRHPTDRKRFTGAHGGDRDAVTHYRVAETYKDGAAMVRFQLETGRTHQIRMHCAEAGMPIFADPLYGGKSVASTSLINRTALHARVLGFRHPDGQDLYFESTLPQDFANAVEKLRNGASWRS